MSRVPEPTDLPVIFIFDRHRDETIACALGCGAADHIVKVFSVTELTARVRASHRCKGSTSFPQLWSLNVPHPQVMSEGSWARTRPDFSLSLSR